MRNTRRITERDISRITKKVINEGLFGGKKNNYKIMRGGAGYIIGSDVDPNAGEILSIKCRKDTESIDRLIEDLKRYKEELTPEEL
jgi:hypothetical protein